MKNSVKSSNSVKSPKTPKAPKAPKSTKTPKSVKVEEKPVIKTEATPVDTLGQMEISTWVKSTKGSVVRVCGISEGKVSLYHPTTGQESTGVPVDTKATPLPETEAKYEEARYQARLKGTDAKASGKKGGAGKKAKGLSTEEKVQEVVEVLEALRGGKLTTTAFTAEGSIYWPRESAEKFLPEYCFRHPALWRTPKASPRIALDQLGITGKLTGDYLVLQASSKGIPEGEKPVEVKPEGKKGSSSIKAVERARDLLTKAVDRCVKAGWSAEEVKDHVFWVLHPVELNEADKEA